MVESTSRHKAKDFQTPCEILRHGVLGFHPGMYLYLCPPPNPFSICSLVTSSPPSMLNLSDFPCSVIPNHPPILKAFFYVNLLRYLFIYLFIYLLICHNIAT